MMRKNKQEPSSNKAQEGIYVMKHKSLEEKKKQSLTYSPINALYIETTKNAILHFQLVILCK